MAWIFEPKDVRDALKAFTRELAGPKAKSLGWTIAPDEDHIRRQFKSVGPSLSHKANPRQCSEWLVLRMNLSTPSQSNKELMRRIVKVAQDMFAKWAKGDKSAIHPDLRSAVFAISIKNGGKKEVCRLEISG